MEDDYMKSEIEELRSKLEELTAGRKTGREEKVQPGGSEGTAGDPAAEVPAATGPPGAEAESVQPEESDLQSQFQELFETIDEELRAANPLTVLVVFALGVLVGRLLPR